ncbi:MAG: DUF6893 family small protein [Kineosporiaceae bacterium]|jgi:hypothetical protein
MRAIGIFTTTLAAGVVISAVVIGARAIPDVKRYLHIRSM